jgi:GNAT superfamily N-acetyltransferase
VSFLDALGDHPYARFTLGMAPEPSGVVLGETIVWWGETAFGRIAHAFGPPVALPPLEGVVWLNHPREWPAPQGWSPREAWDFRWTAVAPPPSGSALSKVGDHSAVAELLDAGHPGTAMRPGHPLIRQWWGIWEEGRLVACAADRSAGDIGVIGAVTVHPGHRGRGHGAAVSAELTRRLLDRYGLCSLGVMEGNDTATRLYARLGYRDVYRLTSVTRLPAG